MNGLDEHWETALFAVAVDAVTCLPVATCAFAVMGLPGHGLWVCHGGHGDRSDDYLELQNRAAPGADGGESSTMERLGVSVVSVRRVVWNSAGAIIQVERQPGDMMDSTRIERLSERVRTVVRAREDTMREVGLSWDLASVDDRTDVAEMTLTLKAGDELVDMIIMPYRVETSATDAEWIAWWEKELDKAIADFVDAR